MTACTLCGSAKKLDAHHIDGMGPHRTKDAANNNEDNLLILCHKCHIRHHHGTLGREEQIVSRYGKGETLQSIADSFGISRERVRQIVKLAGYRLQGLKERNHVRLMSFIETIKAQESHIAS